MPRCSSLLLLLAAPLLAGAPSAHASTVTIDNVVFTYATSAGTEQNNFSFINGAADTFEQNGTFYLPVTVYPNADQTGTPNAGYFYADILGNIGEQVIEGAFTSAITGYSGVWDTQLVKIFTGKIPTGVLFTLAPGTYVIDNPEAVLGSTSTFISSASFTVTQTTISTPDPVAVTPEPSTFAMLGTGLLGVGGVIRRRLADSLR